MFDAFAMLRPYVMRKIPIISFLYSDPSRFESLTRYPKRAAEKERSHEPHLVNC